MSKENNMLVAKRFISGLVENHGSILFQQMEAPGYPHQA
ncbi:hypothetical protein NARC_150070 [Candidatus Nitrosocosmicus arcticus]|uniref:Uncharacterized protein n=1 Tax=Candidatus Nitrosocosmicus arcticus TaxID=2035267 RepID=A0A557SSA1_9ARCH|nr:hypothetical protein NARC_150070 [Candidatus Nitrosocosmicus arcticus]